MPSHTIEEDRKREERFETERDMETMTRMQEILKDPKRLKRVTDMVAGQQEAIKSLSELKARIAKKQES